MKFRTRLRVGRIDALGPVGRFFLAPPKHPSLLRSSTGHIPPQLGDLGALQVLDLSGNNLDGELSRWKLYRVKAGEFRGAKNSHPLGPRTSILPMRARDKIYRHAYPSEYRTLRASLAIPELRSKLDMFH